MTLYMHTAAELPQAANHQPQQLPVPVGTLCHRLATLNAATRNLRDRGLRVVRTAMNLGTAEHPAALVQEILPGALERLLASGECRGRRFHANTGYTTFRGVLVSWEEKPHG